MQCLEKIRAFEGDVGFYPQPNATYGYIREKDATQYECLMEMKYAP